jgi:hypothetical protein
MKRTIVVVATTLILTASQAMAEGLTSPHVNGPSLGFRVECYCSCLDGPEGDPCCEKCIIRSYSGTTRTSVSSLVKDAHYSRMISRGSDATPVSACAKGRSLHISHISDSYPTP